MPVVYIFLVFEFYRLHISVHGANPIVANVSACAVAGLGGLGNEAKRGAKTSQLCLVPSDKYK
jgi:hypothetical protein